MEREDPELLAWEEEIANLALEAIMTAGMHHKIWYLEQIMEKCHAPVEKWRERYEWEPGIPP